MKVFSTIMKVVVALAAVAGAVYVAATYGDKIVAWCKKMLSKCECRNCDCECCNDGECTCDGECDCCCDDSDIEVEVVEQAPVEEVPVVEEAPTEEAAPVADEADFEG